jgi:CHAT domain-containing protein/tetratricopeptide (TPR) repeat protein
MKTTKWVSCLLGSMLVAALPLIQAQTNQDQAGAKPDDKELAEKATKLKAEAAKLHQSGNLKETTEKFSEALEILRQLYPKGRYPQGHPELAGSLNIVGRLLLSQGEYVKAESYLREALAMRQALYPEDRYPQGHADLANSLNNLGILLHVQGEYAKAVSYHREALAMLQALYPKDRFPQGHLYLAITLNGIGSSLQAEGEYAKAEPYFRDAVAMLIAFFPKDRFPQGHHELALILNNLGSLLQAEGEYAKAEPYLRDALAMLQALYPKDRFPQGHQALATGLNNLGLLLKAQGEYAKAEPYYRDALTMQTALYPQERYPHGHPDVATSLYNLGALRLSQGEYAKAETYFRDALAMRQALYPKDRYANGHPVLATTLNNLGSALEAQGDGANAAAFYRETLAMYQALYPKDRYPQGHPYLAISLNNIAALLSAQGENAEAKPYCREALAMQQAHFNRLAEIGAVAQALNFAASLPLTLDGFLSVHRRLPDDAMTYDLVWKSRAPLTKIMQRRHLDIHASQEPHAKKLVLELQNIRQRLASLLLSPAKDAAEHQKNVDGLTAAKEDLENRIARQLRLNLPAPAEQTSPQQLSNALPNGACFIDVVRFTDFSQNPKVAGRKGRRQTPRYLAFVLLGGKPALRVDLGAAAPIDAAWDSWRDAIVNNRPDRQAAAAFAALVWQPLREHLPAKTHSVWFAPDGQLSQVPWAAMPGAQPDTILLEELAVAVVPHGSYLLQRLQDKAVASDGKSTLLTVAGVAYEQAPVGTTDLKDFSLAPIPGDKLIAWKQLPGTAREEKQIADLARKVLQTEPRVLNGADAGMAQVSAELPKVRYAHLATHGFFADPKFRSAFQVDEKQFQHFGSERISAGARSPLVLSGLVLAGANRPETPQRGILTAEAVVGLRLEDLELAVLSACETGLGETAGGEGVFGLQRAFHVAGARNVIASLWRVDDDSTAALMVLFYRKLWLEKQAPLQALREAQLHIYRHPEEIKGLAGLRGIDFTAKDLPKVTPTPPASAARAHTSQWAAFVLSGTGN